MKTGISYYGNRILQHVAEDMEEIARNHCTYVVHTCSENDLQYYHNTIKEIVDISHQAGLEVWLDPWGVGRIFGGEAYSRFACEHLEARQILSDGTSAPAACFNQPAFRDYMRQWTQAALQMGADVLFWDEPHFIKRAPQAAGDLWACRCSACQERYQQQHGVPLPDRFTQEVHRFRHDSVIDFLREVTQMVKSAHRKNAICFLGEQEDKEKELDFWSRVAEMDSVDIIGTDPYWWDKRMDVTLLYEPSAKKIAHLARQHGKEGHMWVQNFMITPQTEDYIRIAIRATHRAGIRNIAAWSYWGAGYMAWLRSENPERVWKILGEEYARLHELAAG
jgi:hypothetical protein